jgi:predicted Zn-dependent peptidase
MKEDIEETRLENGLVILTDRMPGVRSATVGFFFRVGSRNEPDELNGISHFIEHAVFKGTKKRSALDIAIETDRLGGNLDAFTTHEETGFAIKVIDDQLENAFELIADMLVNPSFDEKELKSEQRVIIEEMKMTEDSPEDHLSEIFGAAFFPGHPLGLNITGTPKTVRTFDRKTTRKYHQKVFNAGNLVVAAAGNIEHSHLFDLADTVLSSRFGVPDSAEGKLKFELRTEDRSPKMAAPIVIRQNKNLEQAHLVIATPFVGGRDEKRYAADLLASIIGGGTSSRLWQKIREERGLAYSVGSGAVMFRDCGYFSMFAGTSPEQAEEVIDLAIAEIRNLLKDGVTADELVLAKQQSRASILLSLEDSAARAATLAQSEMIHGCQIPIETTLARIDTVTAEEIRAIADEFFKSDNVAFVALGDLKGLKIDRSRLEI